MLEKIKIRQIKYTYEGEVWKEMKNQVLTDIEIWFMNRKLNIKKNKQGLVLHGGDIHRSNMGSGFK